MAPDHGFDAAAELSRLLAETPAEAQLREQTTYEAASGEKASTIVLFGAGGLGRRTASRLRRCGIEPLAFADNNPALWGEQVEGVQVLSPVDAAERYATIATFVVSIWGAGSTHRFAHSASQLSEYGCETVVPIAWLYWRYPREMLPYYAIDLPSKLLEQKRAVTAAFALCADEQSRAEYVAQVNWRLSGDPGCLSHPVPGTQYLLSDLVGFGPGEVIFDCGAYDGDTLRSWLQERGPTFDRYFAIEPDPINVAHLQETVSALTPEVAERVCVVHGAVTKENTRVSITPTGLPSATLNRKGTIDIEGIRLDDLARNEQPASFVKMDIEGAELDAIEGASELIRSSHPVMTLSIYHLQDHLWRVPLAVAKLWPEYRQFLRPHNEEGWDLIDYAIPPDRVAL